MNVLVVGGGGREHAVCWRLSQNPAIDRLFAAPGNAGIARVATPVRIPAGAVGPLVEFVEGERIDLTVVGPEAPLVSGLADELEARGRAVFGPTREGARIEGSKAWARWLCDKNRIPGPRSEEFVEVGPALDYLGELSPPYVVKADGLAGGKGVTVAPDRAAARQALEDCLVRGVFGKAGSRVLVEEYLEGAEVSAMALTDGEAVVPLALAQDHKRALDGDRGPNTGGMGAYSPVPFVSPAEEAHIEEVILRGAVKALADEGIRYRGVLYAGLMLTADGPKVLEFNCRLGDPETQVVLPRLGPNLLELILACSDGSLSDHRIEWSDQACVGVVVASGGYPGEVETGLAISGLEEAARMEGVQVFHSGTGGEKGRVVTAGGRVLTVTATADGHEDARRRAYEACSAIHFEGMTFRHDIGMVSRRKVRVEGAIV